MLRTHAPLSIPARTATFGPLARVGEGALFLNQGDSPAPPATPPAAPPAAANTPPVAPPANPPAAAPATPPVDVTALQAQLAEKDKALSAANKKLAELEPDATFGKTAREAATKRIDEAKAKLPADQQKIIDALPTLELKEQTLAAFSAKPAATSAPTPPPAGGPPPPAEVIDFKAALADPSGKAWAEAKKRDPDGAAKFFAAQMAPASNRPTPLLHLPRAAAGSK